MDGGRTLGVMDVLAVGTTKGGLKEGACSLASRWMDVGFRWWTCGRSDNLCIALHKLPECSIFAASVTLSSTLFVVNVFILNCCCAF